MTNKESIIKKINQLAFEVLNSQPELQIQEKELLYLIISDSAKAIEFVNIIEDEFEIEFDDDDIGLDFFSSFENISSIIINLKIYAEQHQSY
jgi:acyl carrier protein